MKTFVQKTIVAGVMLLIVGIGISYAAERAANAYKATKLTTTSVLISCNDEREPHVSKLEATDTSIVVTCKQ
jgi:hypothetical protein